MVFTITWTWIVRDACGNETQIIRFVTVTQVADVTNIKVTNEIVMTKLELQLI
ncbi:hypothetical protein [Flavobacterium sp. N1994]|uniref:hypothetical protein n=1 Tax=Flavobacterium sp. N1994 TaxID=2986827 RepID=UPI00222276C7|nr:hypothetical protein [Flavobacterium sp. N1994]